MNRRIPALLCAGMLLLTGCAETRDADLSQRFPEQFRYCFGGQAENTLLAASADASGTVTETRSLYYTDADGTQRSCQYEIVRRDADRDAFRDLLTLDQRAMQIPFMAEFSERLLPQYFDEQFRADDWSIRFSETENSSVYGSADGLWADCEGYFTLSQADADSLGVSCRAYGCDLKTLAQNPFFLLHVSVSVTGAVSAEAAANYRARLQALCQDYIACAGSPQNYIFSFAPANPDAAPDAEPLCIAVLLGKPYEGSAEDAVSALEQQLRVRYPNRQITTGADS